jgi:hypothetical protein
MAETWFEVNMRQMRPNELYLPHPVAYIHYACEDEHQDDEEQ